VDGEVEGGAFEAPAAFVHEAMVFVAQKDEVGEGGRPVAAGANGFESA